MPVKTENMGGIRGVGEKKRESVLNAE